MPSWKMFTVVKLFFLKKLIGNVNLQVNYIVQSFIKQNDRVKWGWQNVRDENLEI